jgi:sulfofructose kinase
MNAGGDRTIVTYRDERIAATAPSDPDKIVAAADLVLADNRYPVFVGPICAAARYRNIPVVLDGDRPTVEDDPLFLVPTHVIFSSECLRATTGQDDLAVGLKRMAAWTDAFLAVSDGPGAILFMAGDTIQKMSVFKIEAVDTLAAGDVFHAGIALALAEGRDPVAAMRFGAAAAGLKCTRFGGSMGAPTRHEVEAFLARQG